MARSRVIRKLGKKENFKLVSECARVFLRNIRVNTSLDLFSRPGVINRTIRQWMSTHPYLQAKVAEIDNENYFVYDERFEEPDWEADSSDLENVTYLVFNSSKLENPTEKSAFYDDLAWLMCERELNIEMDHLNQLLWRLVVLEVDSHASEREYDITLVLHHSISEGRNAHMILLQLLDLIEHNWFLFDNEKTSQNTGMFFEPATNIEELYYANIDKTKYNNQRLENLPHVTKASYIDPENASQSQIEPYNWEYKMSNDWIYRIVSSRESTYQRPFVRLGDLTKRSECIYVKSKRFTLTEQQTSKLLNKCKSENCTVTLAITHLQGFAFKTLESMCTPRDELDQHAQFNTLIPVTMRQFEPTSNDVMDADFVDQLSMGYYISSTVLELTDLMKLAPGELNDARKFWECCRSSTRDLKDIIERREVFFPFPSRNRKPNERDTTNIISNLGILPGKLPDQYALSARTCFTVKKAYSESSLNVPDHCDNGPMYFISSTCNGCLNLSFFYNSYLFSHKRADRVTDIFLKYLNSFTKSTGSLTSFIATR